MITMLILSIVMAVAYVAAVIIKDRELPDSISVLVYELPERWQWLWSAWLAGVTLLMAPALTSAMSAAWWTSLLADATIVCLSMTAAIPLLPGYHNRLHNILGIAAGVLTQVCVWFICPWWLLLWVCGLLLLQALCIPGWKSWVAKVMNVISGKGVLLLELICATTFFASLITPA